MINNDDVKVDSRIIIKMSFFLIAETIAHEKSRSLPQRKKVPPPVEEETDGRKTPLRFRREGKVFIDDASFLSESFELGIQEFDALDKAGAHRSISASTATTLASEIENLERYERMLKNVQRVPEKLTLFDRFLDLCSSNNLR